MAFKASSGFIFGVLLVLVIIYPASSKVMFNSSLEVTEVAEVRGTEIVVDHEIRGRVLQGRGQAWKLITQTFKSYIKGIKPFKLSKTKRQDFDYIQLYKYLDQNYCTTYCYQSTSKPGYCECEDSKNVTQHITSDNPCTVYAVFYCCQGTNGACDLCCEGKNGPRNITAQSEVSSSQPPFAHVVIGVTAILLPSFLF